MRHFMLGLAALAVAGLTACDRCRVPPRDGPHTLEDFEIVRQETDTLNPAREVGGRIDLGPNNSAQNWKDGSPASTATKEFNCGSGGQHCNITFSVSAPYQPRDGESMTVQFRHAQGTRSITFNRQPGATENPVHISLPTCGQVTVTVSGSAGDTPGIQNHFSAGPFHFDCAKCNLEERGGGGT